MAEGKTFCTAINCMDGRTQLPVNIWLTEKYGTDYVDTITEPGPNGILANDPDGPVAAQILARTDISVHKHGSRAVCIVGHEDCAGNPGPREMQEDHCRRAARLLQERYDGVEITAVWLDEDWKVYPVGL